MLTHLCALVARLRTPSCPLLVAALLCLTAFCSLAHAAGPGDWWMFHHDRQHTGRSPFVGPSSPMVKWTYQAGNGIYSSPTFGADGTIYVGSSDGNLYALNPDGSKKWSFATAGQIGHSSPAIGADGTIYFGSNDHKIYALNANGLQKWAYWPGGNLESSPTIGTDGTIYIGSYDNNLYALNPDGTKKWNYTAGGPIWSSPAIGTDGTIYVGSFDGNLYAFNPDGTKKWSLPTGGTIYSSPAIGADGTIYIGSASRLCAINSNGTQQWALTTGSAVSSSPALGADGTIYVGSCDTKCYAVNPNGTQKWTFTTGNSINSSPAIDAAGTIYVGSGDAKCYAVNPNGTQKWAMITGGYIDSCPSIGSDGTLYFGSTDMKLYALGTIPSLTLTKTSSLNGVTAGSTVSYTLTYNNAGNTAATNVTLTDNIPANMTYLPGSASGSYTFNSATNALTWSLGTINAGSSAGTVAFTTMVNVDAMIGTNIVNTASIYCTEVPTPVVSNTVGVTVLAPASLTLTKTASPPNPLVGSPVRYALAFGNAGGSTATNCTLTDTLPVGVTYVPGSATGINSYSTATNTITWSLGTLSAGATGYAVSFQATLNPNVPVGANIVNSAGIYCTEVPGAVTSSAAIVTVPYLGAAGPGDWWMFHHDRQHTGRSPFTGPSSPTVKWTYQAGNGIYSSPTLGADGTLYVGSNDGNLYALNPDGTKKWAFLTGSQIVHSSPAIGADGTLYIGSYDHNVYAINPNGTLKWTYTTWGNIESSPTIGTDGTSYIGSFDNNIYALNPNGTLKWSYGTGGPVSSSPAIGLDATIYVSSFDGNLYALNPDGTKKWSYPIGGQLYASPALGGDGTIYVGGGSGNNKLFAINANGTVKWTLTTGNVNYSTPAIGTDGTVYFGSFDRNLYAVNASGSLKWSYLTGSTIYSSPAIGADGTIYIGSGDTRCYAVNPNGTLKWWLPTGGPLDSSPALGADGTVFIGSGDRKIYAIGPGLITVMPATGPNGAISPNTPQAVSPGGSMTLTATPNSGYVVDTWTVDSGIIAQTGSSSFTLSNINVPHTVMVTFKAAPAFSLAISGSPSSAVSGSTVNYTITYANIGSSAVANVQLVDSLPNPNNSTYVPGTASGAATSYPASGFLCWSLGTLNAGASGTVTFQMAVNAGSTTTVTHMLTLFSPGVSATASATVTIIPTASLAWGAIPSSVRVTHAFPATVTAVDALGKTITGYNGTATVSGFAPYLFDGFETGTLSGNWFAGTGAYTRAVTTSTAAVGTQHSVTLIGGNHGQYDGLNWFYPAPAPGRLIFYVKKVENTLNGGYVVTSAATPGAENTTSICTYFVMNANGMMGLQDGGLNTNGIPYQPGVWYKVTQDFNWTTHTVNLSINDAPVLTGFPFRNPVPGIRSVCLFNSDNTQAFWDEFQCLQTIAPVTPTNITMVNGVWSGTVTVGQATPSMYLQATAPGITGYSNSFAVTVNQAPVAKNLTLITCVNQSASGQCVATDAEKDPLTYSIVTPPMNGVITNWNAASGLFTYTPNAGYSGTDLLVYKANDGSADSNTATISVAVNNASIVQMATVKTLPNSTVPVPIVLQANGNENSLTFSVNFDPTKLSNPTVTLGVDALSAQLLVNNAQASAGNIGIGLALSAGQAFPAGLRQLAIISFQTGATAGPLTIPLSFIDTPVSRQISSVSASALNAQWLNGAVAIDGVPVAIHDTYTAYENKTLTVTAPGVLVNDTDADGDPLTATLASPPMHGTLSLNSDGSFTYIPAAEYIGFDTFVYQAGDGLASGTNSVTINVMGMNDPPTISAIPTQTVNENASAQTITLTGLTPGDADDAGQTLSVWAVSSNPSLIPSPNVSGTGTSWTLTYTPVAEASGSASITVYVQDNGGGSDTTATTFSVIVTPVNDPPTINTIPDQSVNENAGTQIVTLTGITPGDADDTADIGQTMTITATSSNPALIPNPTVAYTNPNTVASLIYTPVANAWGTAMITVTVQDNGGTLNGGQDTATTSFVASVNFVNDPPTINIIPNRTVNENTFMQSFPLNGISPGDADDAGQTVTIWAVSSNPTLIPNPTINYTNPSTTGQLTFYPVAEATGTATITVTVQDNGGTANGGQSTVVTSFTVTVLAVNDPPTINTIPNQTIYENATAQTLTLSGITPGDADDAGQTVSITAISSNPALIPNPNVSGTGTTWSLVYTPVAEATGSALITVTVQDNGGTANGGVNTKTTAFTVTVLAVNDPPTITTISNQTIYENATAQTLMLTGITPGDADDAGQTVTITALSNNPALIPDPNVSGTSTTWSLVYTPVAEATGTAIITVTVQDNGGTANGGVNTTTTAFTITVLAVNDPPTINTIPNQTVNENATAQTLTLSGITPGDADDAGQTVSITAISSNPALIPNPNVSGTGTTWSLVYTPVAEATGSALITVTVQDNGGTANGGVNTKTTPFTVTVLAVNDPPTITTIPNQTIYENATAQTLTLTGITPGDADDAGQTVTITALSSNPALIPNPTVSYSSPSTTGSLTYSPVANVSGTAVITVTVTDNGGTANGGQNVTTTAFTITVNFVNDPPTINPLLNKTIYENVSAQSFMLTGITAGDADDVGQTVTITAVSSNPSVVPNPTISYTSPGTTGTLFYAPVAEATGTAVITVTVQDNGGTANGGVNTTTTAFTITVLAVNDPPTINPISNQVINEEASAQTMVLTGITPGDADDVGQTVSVTAVSSNPALIPNPNVSGTGTTWSLTYQPVAYVTGSALITVTVQDNGGILNGGMDTTARTFTVTVNAINHPPVAVNDSYSTAANGTLYVAAPGVLGNDTDIDAGHGDFLTAGVVSGTGHGTLALYIDGSFRYTPAHNFVGTDSFVYKAIDTSNAYSTALVTIFVNATGWEADVAPRDTGDGDVTATDWTQLGRFAAGLDTPTPGLELMKADCAPLATHGDGLITVADWVQAGRFAMRLDPLAPVAGPSGLSTSPHPGASASATISRMLAIQPATITRTTGATGAVTVALTAQGNEHALGVTIGFDPKALTYKSATLAAGLPSGTTLVVNANKVSQGQLGILLELPLPQVLPAGVQSLLQLTFAPTAGGTVASTVLNFGDNPVIRQIVDVTANVLPVSYTPGTINLLNPQPDLSICNYGESSYIGAGALNLDGTGQTKAQTTTSGTAVHYFVQLKNAGTADDSFTLTCPAANAGWKVQFVDWATGKDITAAVNGAGWKSAILKAGATTGYTMHVTPDNTVVPGAVTLTVTASSTADATKKDVVKAITTLVAKYLPDVAICNYGDATYAGFNIINLDGTGQTKGQTTTAGTAVHYFFQVKNDGYTADSYTLTCPSPGAGWKVQFVDWSTGRDITSAIMGAGFKSLLLQPGATTGFTIHVTPDTTAPAGPNTLIVTATATGDSTKKDVVKAVTTVATGYQPDLLICNYGETTYTGTGIFNLTGVNQTKSQTTTAGKAVHYFFQVKNAGNTSDVFTLRCPLPTISGWQVQFVDWVTGKDITATITKTGFATIALKQNAMTGFTIHITPTVAAASAVPYPLLVTATSSANQTKQDAVKAVTTKQ